MRWVISSCAMAILDELKRALADVSDSECNSLTEMICRAKRIFVTGSGRSLLVMRCFAMRLMQIGFTAYVAGDTCTPAIGVGDLLIAATGSGQTKLVCSHLETARKFGAETACFTLYGDSPAAQLCNRTLIIPGTSAKASKENAFHSMQLVGSTFEQGVMILCDAIAAELAGRNEDHRGIMRLHANLE